MSWRGVQWKGEEEEEEVEEEEEEEQLRNFPSPNH